MDADAKHCKPCNSSWSSVRIKQRLIVCCDGTFVAANQGNNQFASNVARLSRVISRIGVTEEGEKISQIVYYQAGVATGSLNTVDKSGQGLFGGGLNEKVCEAVNFIANNWAPGDEIFLFGFSRGAYTARSIAGFICQVGLLTPLMLEYFYDVYEGYKSRKVDGKFEHTEWAKTIIKPGELGMPESFAPESPITRLDWLREVTHQHVKIKAIGVWDTVGGLGISGWVPQPGVDRTFQYTELHPSKYYPGAGKLSIMHEPLLIIPEIENAFQALALDESRGMYPPTLWYLNHDCKKASTTPNLRQVWFPGYHADIGGHDDASSDTNSIDEITFAWMCDQIFGLLQLSGTALQRIFLFRIGEPDPELLKKSIITNAEAMRRTIAWSDGRLIETNTWTNPWWVYSLAFTRRMSYLRRPGETMVSNEVDGKEQPVTYQDFKEEIHPCVFHRMRHSTGYQPKSLPATSWTRRGSSTPNETGFEWVKKLENEQEITLKEYIIPKLGQFQPGTGCDHWQGSLERTLAPAEVLKEQDK